MFHNSELKEYAEHFPQDQLGYIPTVGDSWRQMKFDHADQDPNEKGISNEERARRIEFLDQQWWPQLLEKVDRQRRRLEELDGDSFIERWEEAVNKTPAEPHGFEVE